MPIHEGLTHEQYSELPGLRRGVIMDYIDDPELYHARHVTGDIPQRKQNSRMEFGTIVDDFLSYGETLSTTPPESMIPIPENLLGKGGKVSTKAAKEFVELHAKEGREAVPQSAIDSLVEERVAINQTLATIQDEINAHDVARKIMRAKTAQMQLSIDFERPDGTKLKSRPDLVVPGLLSCNFKVSDDVKPRFTNKQIERFGYDVAEYMVREAWEREAGERLPNAYLMVIRSKPPHRVEVYAITKWLEYGQRRLEEALAGIKSKRWRNLSHGLATPLGPSRYLTEGLSNE